MKSGQSEPEVVEDYVLLELIHHLMTYKRDANSNERLSSWVPGRGKETQIGGRSGDPAGRCENAEGTRRGRTPSTAVSAAT